jgi:Flp pilus assembly protein TadB
MTASAIAVEGTAAAEMALSGVTSPVAALLALAAAALLAVYGSGPRRLQALVATAGVPATGPQHSGRPARRRSRDDPADVAAAWEQLAVCLEAGLPVAAAVAAAAATLPGLTGGALGRVAGLLELGADPTQAWNSVEDVPNVATFARAAGRSAGTGAALARAARTEGSRVRADLADGAEARAQRAGVLVAGPLGLCFLPAFLVLGVVPVVVGLATEVLQQW